MISKIKSTATIGALSLIAAGIAAASEEYDDRWYAVPSLSYISPDKERDSETSASGFGISMGKPVSKSWNLELYGMHDKIEFEKSDVNNLQTGLLLDALYVINREAKFSPYAVIGAGAMNNRIQGDDNINPVANAGVGFMYQVSDYGMEIRSDLRYRADFDDRKEDVDNFNDVVFTLGLVLPLSEKVVKTASMAAFVPVAAAAAAEPVKIVDKDSDGIDDSIDKCLNTPSNVNIDKFGCEVDSDGDKIADSLDKCDNTPANVITDATGCPVDTDKDGIADYMDQCNDTPADVTTNSKGCPVDSDNDGIADYMDQCDNTPAGALTDAMGCLPDADKDGIVDALDKCPNSPASTKAGTDGCSLAEILSTKQYQFEFNSTALTDSTKDTLNDLAVRLKEHPEDQLEIVGHADNIGSDMINKLISEQRAVAVKEYLVTQGIEESRLITKGFGQNNPIADNATDQGRAKNRRVEMFVSDE